MKSHSDNLLHIVAGILTDIRRAYPQNMGLDRDFSRLSLLVEKRGLGIFTLDLPARDSSLLKGLETGLLDSKGTILYSKNYPVPRLFAGLYMRIFDKNLRLRDECDINAVAFLRQLLCIGKKTEVPCSKKRKFQAIKEYFDVEHSLIKPSLSWGNDTLGLDGVGNSLHLRDRLDTDLPLFPGGDTGYSARISLLLDRCQRVADYVAGELGLFCPDCAIEARRAEGTALGPKHGPGAVAERSGRFFDKNSFSNWSTKLQNTFPFSSYGKMPLDPRDKPRNHEVPARLICVPKTAKGPRIIAAEPSEHMYVQKFTESWLIERTRNSIIGSFIDFKDQTKSGKLVLSASLDRKLATIDLSSASDRLSLWLVERIFRSNPALLKILHATRTRWIRSPDTGETVELRKFASQGTAVTFPIQSLVFLVLALSVSLKGPPTKERLQKLRNQVRVYGDDIIIPNTGYVDMVDLLHTLHLKVNVEKSFSNGSFRESCGVDAFKGYDVTPIKPKTTMSDNPACRQATLDTINNLFYKGYWYGSRELENRQPSRTRQGYGLVGRYAGATGYGSFSFGTFCNREYSRIAGLRELDDIAGKHGRSLRHQRRCNTFYSVDELRTRLQHVFSNLGVRFRFNHRLQRPELRVRTLSSHAKARPYDDGYSGLLQRQLLPSHPRSLTVSGLEGVPERPHQRELMRWEPLSSFI